MVANVLSKGMMAVAVTPVVLVLTLALGACGVKSSPQFPEGSTYPREYPYASPKQGALAPAPAPSAPSATVPDKTRESDQGQRSPLGFLLEYPNRPSYK